MRLLQLMMATAVMFTSTAMAQIKANFSGKWQLDVINSTNLAKDNTKIVAIVQDSAAITINRAIVTSENSLKRAADTIYLDGAVHPVNKNRAKDFHLPAGKVSGFTRASTLAWSDGGKSLTINTSYGLTIDDKPFKVKTVEKWTLDSTGQKLTISGITESVGNSENYSDIYARIENN